MSRIKLDSANSSIVIAQVITTLEKGGVVVYPTDTVYGLLVDATNLLAIKRLIRFKERPAGKPISIFVSDFEMMKREVYVEELVQQRLNAILPGPFTIVLPSKHRLPTLLEAESGTLGVRFPRYRPVTDLVAEFGKPVTATSANVSYQKPHYSIDSLLSRTPNDKLELISLLVDAGELKDNKPSTVIDLTTPNLSILRQGDHDIDMRQVRISGSSDETKSFGWEVADEAVRVAHDKPVILILQGQLGAGKTQFVKGVGERLGIYTIISPTYVVYYEYATQIAQFNSLLHVDLYNVNDKEEFEHLGLESYLRKGVLWCIEWGEKTGDIIELLKDKADIKYITFKYTSQTEREIVISEKSDA